MRLAALLLCCLGCDAQLGLPSRPGTAPPHIDVVKPGKAFSGARIVVEGTGLGSDPRGTTVTFGDTTIHPESIDETGTRLTVVVPDQLAAGATSLLVTNAGGSAGYPYFESLGLGHLARRHVRVERDLRPEPDLALQIAGGEGALFRMPFANEAAVVFTDGSQGMLPIESVRGLARVPGTDKIAIVWEEPGEAVLGFVDDDALIGVRLGVTPDVTEAMRFDLQESLSTTLLAVTGDGRYVVIVNPEVSWILDVKDEDVTRVDEGGTGVSLLEGTRFAVAGDSFVRILDAASPDDEPDVITLPVSIPPGIDVLAALPGQRLAAGTVDGEVLILDLSGSPAIVAQSGTRTPDRVTSIAASVDGRRIAAVVRDADVVVVFALENGDFLPISTVTVERPGGVTAEPDGTFHVATKGGSVVLAQVTGSVLGRVRFRSELTSPVFVEAECGAPRALVAAAAQTLFNRIVRVNPATGLSMACKEPSLAGKQLSSLAALPAGLFFSVWGPDGTVVATEPDGAEFFRWAPDDAFRLPSVSRRVPWPLAVFPDSFTALLTYPQALANDPDREFRNSVAVMSLPGFPSQNEVLSVGVTTSEILVGAWAAGTTLFVAGGSRLRFLDLSSAHRGTEKELGGLNVVPDRVDGADVQGGSLWLFTHDDANTYVRLIDGVTREATPRHRFPNVSGAVIHVAPGGRRIYLLRDEAAGARLESVIVDSATGTVLGEESPIALPAGTKQFVLSPDGESIVAINPDQDRLFILE